MPKYTINYADNDKQEVFLASADKVTIGDSKSTITIKGEPYYPTIDSIEDGKEAPASSNAVFDFVKQKVDELNSDITSNVNTIDGKALTSKDVIIEGNYTINTIPVTKQEGSKLKYPILSSYVIKNLLSKLETAITTLKNSFSADSLAGNGLAVSSDGKLTVNLGSGLTLDKNKKITLNLSTNSSGLINSSGALTVSCQLPIYVNTNTNKVTLSYTSPLTLVNGNTLTVDCTSPIELRAGKLALDSNSIIPIGAILPFTGNEAYAPAGFQYCRGQDVSINSVSDILIGRLANMWGNGSYAAIKERGYIKMPNFQGKFLRGFDPTGAIDKWHLYNGSATLVGTGKRSFGSTQEASAPNISGRIIREYQGKDYISTDGCLWVSNTYSSWATQGGGWANSPTIDITFDASRSNSVYKWAMGEVRPINVAINYIIRVW